MATNEKAIVFDLRFLLEASKKLHGYFLHRWFVQYLALIVRNAQRLMDYRLIGPDARPSEETDYLLTFDVDALDLHAITDLIGYYFYILASHKKSNYCLMQKNDIRRVLFFRGFDYEGAVSSGAGVAAGYYSMHTMRFTHQLGDHLAHDFQVFKPLSSMDLYWETIEVQNHFYGDYENVIHFSSEPIRSIYLNAKRWQKDVAQLVDRMDYFVVYVSSITRSVFWELDLLKRKQRMQHATVVFDEEAITNKETQTHLQEAATELYPDGMRWANTRSGAPALSAKQLRDRLAKKFVVVSPDEFFAQIDVYKKRIARARAPLGPGRREAPVDFRFYPALDAAELKKIRDFDKALDRDIRRKVSSRAITNLPWFMNQVQLKIFTTLMLGNHAGTGRALAVYAAVADVVRKRMLARAWPGKSLTKKERLEIRKLLEGHFEMADYISYTLLSSGQSHEFGDYRARAKEIYEETFAAAAEAVEGFFEEAQRRGAD